MNDQETIDALRAAAEAMDEIDQSMDARLTSAAFPGCAHVGMRLQIAGLPGYFFVTEVEPCDGHDRLTMVRGDLQ